MNPDKLKKLKRNKAKLFMVEMSYTLSMSTTIHYCKTKAEAKAKAMRELRRHLKSETCASLKASGVVKNVKLFYRKSER